MVERAVNVLLAAGMVLRYRSSHGNSFYLGWSGRSGVLRISDHGTSRREDAAIVAKLTFSDLTRDLGEEQFKRRVATALGTYLIKSQPGTAPTNPFGPDWPQPSDGACNAK